MGTDMVFPLATLIGSPRSTPRSGRPFGGRLCNHSPVFPRSASSLLHGAIASLIDRLFAGQNPLSCPALVRSRKGAAEHLGRLSSICWAFGVSRTRAVHLWGGICRSRGRGSYS